MRDLFQLLNVTAGAHRWTAARNPNSEGSRVFEGFSEGPADRAAESHLGSADVRNGMTDAFFAV